MKKKIKAKGINIIKVLFLIIICSSCNSTKEEVYIKLNVQDGFEQIYEFSETTSGSLINLEKVNVIKILLNTKNEKSFLFDANLISVYSKSNFGGTIDIYDSKKELTSMSESELVSHEEYKKLLESTLSFELNDKGETLKGVKQKNGDEIEFEILDLNNFQISYPESKVTVGSTWETTWQNNVLTPTTIKAKYKVSNITANTIEIKATQTISQSKSLFSEIIKEGEYVINRNSGVVNSMKMKTKLQMGGELSSTITKTTN